MPPSIVEKYEQILAADPRSRIFVELAKALVDRGEHVRAIEVCRRGLDHHPSSILGRVVWGRALLETGEPKGAMDQFEIAIALDPASPYAFNLVGEALLAKGLHRDALPVLARAVELQPADSRVRGWLEEARRGAKGEAPAPAAAAPSAKVALEDEDDRTEPYRPIAPRNGAARASAAPVVTPRPETSTSAATNGAVHPERRADTSAEAQSRGTTPAAPAGSAAASPGAPPPLPSTPPPLNGGRPTPRSVLYMIPGEVTRDVVGPAAARPGAAPDAAEAERIAAQYAQQLREQLLAAPEPPPSRLRRHRRLAAALAVLVAAGAAAGVYLAVDARHARALAGTAALRARAGLARDTLGSLREASRLLSDARRAAPADAELVSLAAQVDAVLAADYGDDDARRRAEALAADPLAGDGALVVRDLLAATPAARAAADAEVLAARPSSAPLLQALAGRILVARGEVDAGRGRLEIAAHANPPLLRALAELGDATLAAGDAAGALSVYGAALAAQPTHARSAVGAAEARLALGKDLDRAAQDLGAIDADPASAPPRALRLRFELAFARVLAAQGDASAAAARLSRAAQELGETAPLAAALAEVQLAARRWDAAEAAAARAVERAPKDVSYRLLLARARIGRGKLAEALAATDGVDGRAVRIQRAIARYRLGQFAEARAELERTARDGKMPAEAAVWYALTDVALGRASRAVPLLEKLAVGKAASPLALVALGRAREAQGDPARAEAAYRAAVAHDPRLPEAQLALGRFLVSHGRVEQALRALDEAVLLDAADLDAHLALGEARLAAGKSAAARAELDAVLVARPTDAAALTLLSGAWLAEKQPAEARRAADRAVAAAPADPRALAAAARAAHAAGDRAAARKLAERALKAKAQGKDAADAKRIVSESGGGKKLGPVADARSRRRR